MSSQDYHASVTATILSKETFNKISQVSKWWSAAFEGSSSNVGDVFTVRFKKSGDWYTIRIDAMIPNQKIEWSVVDAEQTWHENRKEWVGTRIVWEIVPEKNGSKVTMAHLGLVPEFECYEKCKIGWDYLLKESLYKYLTVGTGTPV
jgi:hypothetical protein